MSIWTLKKRKCVRNIQPYSTAGFRLGIHHVPLLALHLRARINITGRIIHTLTQVHTLWDSKKPTTDTFHDQWLLEHYCLLSCSQSCPGSHQTLQLSAKADASNRTSTLRASMPRDSTIAIRSEGTNTETSLYVAPPSLNSPVLHPEQDRYCRLPSNFQRLQPAIATITSIL